MLMSYGVTETGKRVRVVNIYGNGFIGFMKPAGAEKITQFIIKKPDEISCPPRFPVYRRRRPRLGKIRVPNSRKS